jgi:AAHS family 4-hydroxybenzoate transporter-like MFS transporter
MAEKEDSSIRITTLVDGLPMKGPLLLVHVLCALLMLTEGIDTFGVGFVSPYLSHQYRISTEQLGLVYSGTVVASLLGATLIAPLSDRMGRRTVLLLTSLLMGPATLLTPIASSVQLLFLLRFVIGLGFGAALPCALSLAADYAPARHRSLLLLMPNTGISVGMMLAGLGAALIIPHWGWQALLAASATLSLAITALAWVWLPESLQFLARRDPADPRLRGIAVRLAPALASVKPLTLAPEPLTAKPGSPMALARDGRALRTLALWFLMSLGYVLINFNGYWMPTAILATGASMQQTGLLVSFGKFGGVCASLAFGWVADRRGLSPIVCLALFVTALTIVLTGATAAVPVTAAIFLTLSCVLLNPVTGGMQALTIGSYPSELRSVAMGWVSGFARLIGGGAGTLAGGYMIEHAWNSGAMTRALALAPFLAGIVVLLLWRADGSDRWSSMRGLGRRGLHLERR